MMKRNTLPLLAALFSAVFVFATSATIFADDVSISGKITPEGTLIADDGQEYAIIGDKASELLKNSGVTIEVKGKVEEKQGQKTLSVIDYKLPQTPSPESMAIETSIPAPLAEKDLEKH